MQIEFAALQAPVKWRHSSVGRAHKFKFIFIQTGITTSYYNNSFFDSFMSTCAMNEIWQEGPRVNRFFFY